VPLQLVEQGEAVDEGADARVVPGEEHPVVSSVADQTIGLMQDEAVQLVEVLEPT
jgi:hypothetical protein